MNHPFLGMLAALCLWSGTVHAKDEPIRLDFQAGEGCPTAADMVDQVRARTPRVRLASAQEAGLPILIRAHAEGDHAVGSLRVGTSDEGARQVTGRTCAEVVAALSLIVALAVDPAVWPGAPRVTSNREAVVTRNDAPPEATGVGATAIAARAVPPDAIEPHDRTRLRGWFGGAGARAEAMQGLGPRAISLTGGSLFGEAGFAAGGFFRPAVRLGAAFGDSSLVRPEAAQDVGAATFRLYAGRLSACPVELGPRTWLVVRPCAGLEVGVLVGKGRTVDMGSVTEPGSGSMLRIAAQQGLQGQLRLVGPVWLEVEGWVTEPLLRQNFVFRTPDVAVASVSSLELAGAAGLGLRFP